MDPKRVEKYFKPVSLRPGIILAVIGLIFAAALPSGGKVFGILLLLAGVALIYFQFAGRPTDDEIQAEIDKLGAAAKATALTKLGLDPDEVKLIDPVTIEGPRFGGGSMYRKGKDGVVRTSVNEVMVLFFSEHEVHSYTAVKDLRKPTYSSEATDEYFYRDVVSVATQTDSARTPLGEVTVEKFKLTTSGGTSILCSAYDGGGLGRSINGMRSLIKQKKNAAAQ